MILHALSDLQSLLGREQRDLLLRLGVTHGARGRAAFAEAAADPARLRAEAHALRGAVAPFGASELVALLLRVEKGEAVAASEVDAAIATFVAACETALRN